MKRYIDRWQGEGELLQGTTHAAYCKYLINVYQEADKTSMEGSITLSKDGLNEAAFKKTVLYVLFHRTEPFRLQIETGKQYNIAIGEFNAFAGEGVIHFTP